MRCSAPDQVQHGFNTMRGAPLIYRVACQAFWSWPQGAPSCSSVKGTATRRLCRPWPTAREVARGGH